MLTNEAKNDAKNDIKEIKDKFEKYANYLDKKILDMFLDMAVNADKKTVNTIEKHLYERYGVKHPKGYPPMTSDFFFLKMLKNNLHKKYHHMFDETIDDLKKQYASIYKIK